MIAAKFGLIIAYAIIVSAIILWVFWVQSRRDVFSGILSSRVILVVFIAIACGLVAAREMPSLFSPFVLALGLTVPFVGLGIPAVAASLSALPVLAGLTWWAPAIQLSGAGAAGFASAGLVIASLPRLFPQQRNLAWLPVLALLALLSGLSSLATGVFSAPSAFSALWHHWGAYVMPAEALMGGGVPFRDFPVQYGMGPTLLIAALGGGDPWRGTYLAVVVGNLLYLLALSGCVLLLSREARRGIVYLGLAATACAALLWTGYPPDYLGSLVAPSVAGLRFLPLSALLFCIIYSELAGRPGLAIGRVLWLLGVAWSPEAAFYSTLTWWPYLALRRAQHECAPRRVWLALLGVAAMALTALLCGLAALAFVFRLAFGEWPLLSGYLTYVLHPPGIIEPNFQGPIWLLLAAVAGFFVVMPRYSAQDLRVGLACICAMAAVSSYYLGRSHDNNLLNITPFICIVFIFYTSRPQLSAVAVFSRTVLSGIVVWPLTFGFGSWVTAFTEGDVVRIGPDSLLSQMRMSTPAAYSLVDRSLASVSNAVTPTVAAGAAVSWLREKRAGQILFVNPSYVQIRDMPGPMWTGMTNLANFALLPPEVIQAFIRRGAESFHREGWILVDRSASGPWLDHFRVAYDIAEEHMFGGYTAYRMVPR